MIREKEIFLTRLMKFTDILIIGLSFITAYFITLILKQYFDLGQLAFAPSFSFQGAFYFLKNHVWLVLVTIPSWISLMSVDGVYLNFRTKPFIEISFRILRTGILSLLVLGSAVFILKMTLTSRFYVITFAATSYGGLLFEKYLWRRFLDYSHRKGYDLVHVLIVGSGRRARNFIEVVHMHANWGLKIIGIVDDDPRLLGKKVLNYEIIGRIRDIPRLIRDQVVDRVIFVVPRMWLSRIEDAIAHCEREGIDTAVSVDLYQPKLARLVQSNFSGIPLVEFHTVVANEGQLLIKRIIDIVISLVVLLIFSPILLFSILLIKTTSRGPIFYRQVRCGLNGRTFTLYKFRSMVVGAEMRKRELEKQNEMSGPVFKMRRDPRVTPFGKFMRKFSIDELPQLFNVIRGDMSLVGPRPALPAEIELYESWQRRRLSMKPGVTCIWQVSGRNKIDFERWMEMDLQYIDSFSLWLDIRILIRTVFVVITGYGAL